MPMPPPFWHFCQFIGLPPALARCWWKALTHARWSEATAFRQAFGLTHGLADGIAAPRHTIVVVEALVQEGCLPRRDANAVEECVLQSMLGERWMTRAEQQHRSLPHVENL